MTARATGLDRRARDRKGKSSDSPVIPDRRVASDSPSLSLGGHQLKSRNKYTNKNKSLRKYSYYNAPASPHVTP